MLETIHRSGVYANRVCSLFAALPNFETFDTAVDIIDLDGDDVEYWGTTKRRLSASDDDGWTTKRRMTKSTTTTNADDNVPDDNNNNTGSLEVDQEHKEGTRDKRESKIEGQGNEEHGFLTEEEEEMYISTYHEIVDKTGKVIAMHAVDSRAPEDAADNQHISFTEVKDDNGNVVRRIYGEYKRKEAPARHRI